MPSPRPPDSPAEQKNDEVPPPPLHDSPAEQEDDNGPDSDDVVGIARTDLVYDPHASTLADWQDVGGQHEDDDFGASLASEPSFFLQSPFAPSPPSYAAPATPNGSTTVGLPSATAPLTSDGPARASSTPRARTRAQKAGRDRDATPATPVPEDVDRMAVTPTSSNAGNHNAGKRRARRLSKLPSRFMN